jgi:uncharacterized protein
MLGEAKWRRHAVGVGEMEQLRHIRELVGTPAGPTRLVLFSRSGPTDELVEEPKGSPDVELVDLERLYSGSHGALLRPLSATFARQVRLS